MISKFILAQAAKFNHKAAWKIRGKLIIVVCKTFPSFIFKDFWEFFNLKKKSFFFRLLVIYESKWIDLESTK